MSEQVVNVEEKSRMEQQEMLQAPAPPQLQSSASKRQKQLLFDRRYGWVYEEWTDPIEVANSGSRGMFSVVPLTAAAMDKTLQLANFAADAVVRSLQRQKAAVSWTQYHRRGENHQDEE